MRALQKFSDSPYAFHSKTQWHSFLFVVIAGLTWAWMHQVSSPNLDSYGDMLESYAWGQYWSWGGNSKHPPFFGWIGRVWFSVFPNTTFSFKILAFTQPLIGLGGVMVLARQLKLKDAAPAAALLLLWSFPYTTLGAKFNANSPLLALWPWTAVAFWACFTHSTWRSRLWAVLLGVLAAASMLTKYYSGVFLLGLALLACTQPARLWSARLNFGLALLVFLLCLAPHLLWLASHGYPTWAYVQAQGNGNVDFKHFWGFALAPWLYWGLAWLLCVSLASAFALPGAPAGRWRRWLHALARSWSWQRWNDPLLGLALLPWLITLGFGLSGQVELSLPWAIPLGYAFPLLWLRNLTLSDAEVLRSLSKRLWQLTAVLLPIGCVASVVLAAHRAHHGHPDYYRPTEEAARQLHANWQANHPSVPLGWTAGSWPESALIAFYADSRVAALPAPPDVWPATISPQVEADPAHWFSVGGLIICPLAQSEAAAPANDCQREAVAWLQTHQRPVIERRITAQRSGWRFPKPIAATYVSYDVLPLP